MSKYYLTIYNSLQLYAWGFILNLMITRISKGQYDCNDPVLIHYIQTFQLMMVMEMFHIILKLSSGSLVSCIMQLLSRLLIANGTIAISPNNIGCVIVVLCWSITEVVRYSHYISQATGINLYPLTWLRYTLFLILYPLGYSGELLTMYYAHDKLSACCPRKYSLDMPNKFNLGFDFYYFFYFIYAPLTLHGFWKLYSYMLRQRREKLGKKKDS